MFSCVLYTDHPPLSDMFERASSEEKEVVVMGDMNCNLLVSTSLVDQLLLITEESNLMQPISEPAQITRNSQTLMDALFSSDLANSSTSGTVAFTGNDHLMIYAEHVERAQLHPSGSQSEVPLQSEVPPQ